MRLEREVGRNRLPRAELCLESLGRPQMGFEQGRVLIIFML